MSLSTHNLEPECFLPFLSFQIKIFKVLKSEYLTFWTTNIRPLTSDSLWGSRILVWKLSSLEHPGSLEALSRCWERWLDIIHAGLGVHYGVWGFTVRVLFLFIVPLVRWVSIPNPTKHYCIFMQQHSLVEKEQAVKPARLGLAVWFPASWPWTWGNQLLLWECQVHALEKETATHSSILAWRIPGMGEPGGLPSMGSHRVGHNWSDLAAAAAAAVAGSSSAEWSY